MREWYTNIVSDKGNWPILLDAIEQQIDLSDSLHIKLKEEMKNDFISYANGKKDLKLLKDFHNVILKLKSPIMKKLSLSHDPSHLKVVNTLYHDIIKEKFF